VAAAAAAAAAQGSVRGLIVENTFSSVRAMGIELFPPLRLVPAAVLDALQASRWDNEERVAELEGGAAPVAPRGMLFWLGFPCATSVLVTKY
jgi:hypothetical protein